MNDPKPRAHALAYAALPEYGINTASHAHFRVLGFTADQMLAFADATHALRASHGQAPAGAGEPTEQQILEAAFAPAQPGAEPAPSATAHVGDSLFESWFSEYNPAHRGTKQQMRDAYAAGMGDPKAQPSPTPQASHGQAPTGANENAKLVTLIAECRDAFPIPAHGDPIENYWSAAIEDPSNVPAYLQEIAKRKQADSVLYDPKAVLDVFNSARAGSDKSSGYLRGILAVIAHWESRPEPHRWMVPVQAQAAESVPAGDERATFEANWRARNPHMPLNSRLRDDGRYGDHLIQKEWEAWQARAARASADSVQEDAARYRWLRDETEWEPFDSVWLIKNDIYGCPTLAMDVAIDAARKQGATQ